MLASLTSPRYRVVGWQFARPLSVVKEDGLSEGRAVVLLTASTSTTSVTRVTTGLGPARVDVTSPRLAWSAWDQRGKLENKWEWGGWSAWDQRGKLKNKWEGEGGGWSAWDQRGKLKNKWEGEGAAGQRGIREGS